MVRNVVKIFKNYALCHLSIKNIINSNLVVMPEGLSCFVCGERKRVAIMLLCYQCQRSWHMTCLRPLVTSPPSGQWSCPRC